MFARVKGGAAFEKVLQSKNITFEKTDDGLLIQGKKTDDIGKLAFDSGVIVLELANHNASLEDAFLELTADATEYTSQPEKETKK